MDVKTLSIVSGSATPDESFVRLRASKRSALIVDNAGEHWLAWANTIDEARRQGKAAVADASNLERIYTLQSADISNYALNLARPRQASKGYESLLDQANRLYAVVTSTDDAVVLVTRHETLGNLLGGLVLECDGPPYHIFPQPEVHDGDDCPLCPAGAKVHVLP